MADQVRSLVMVENETYELIDGDGNFYVSKTNLGPISPTFQTNDPFATLANTDYHETFSAITENQISQMNQFSVQLPPPSNMEPILINDYGKMNFTQAASNVTIYLNSYNGGSFINDSYAPDSSEVIDLTISSSEECRKQDVKEEQDIPEFIDLSQLKLPCQDSFFNNKKDAKEGAKVEEGDENDVVFVKEYKIETDLKDDQDFLPLDLRSKSEESEKSIPEPRRNPKRTVQLLKEYYNSINYNPDLYGRGKRRRECCDGKKKLALNPPSLLTSEHFKEWPTEGMHEKPTYNAASKKLEKFEGKEKKRGPARKMKEGIKRKTFRRGKRRVGKVKIKEENDEQVSKEFATLTHETFQEVIGYVQQVKECYSIMKGKYDKTETASKADGNETEAYLQDVKDILTDSCLLYSIANDVPQESVSKYLKTIRKDSKL